MGHLHAHAYASDAFILLSVCTNFKAVVSVSSVEGN